MGAKLFLVAGALVTIAWVSGLIALVVIFLVG